MKPENTITVTVESEHKKLSISINKFANINEWITVFKSILISQTFDESIVRELFESWEDPHAICEGCYYREKADKA